MVADIPVTLQFAPGIQRDGTRFDGNRCIDGQWCRWRLGKPRKMGGFQLITDALNGVPRRIHMFYNGDVTIIHIGTTNGIQQVTIDRNGNQVSMYDRTPAGFDGGPTVGWTLDAVFDTVSGQVQLIGHAIADVAFLANATQLTPFIGQIDSTSMLVPFSVPDNTFGGEWTLPQVSGGIVGVQPYIFDFSSAGLVQWCAPNLPLTLGVIGGTSGAGQARISAQKIVAGASLRGGGANSPAALFWSLSEVISATFIGGTNVWAFNTVSPSSSILSTDCVIEYDGLFFWAGIDRFMVYNGTVVEIPNQQNQDWFFDNINWEYAAKCAAFKIPRYGEIWWVAPLFGATEPSHAVIYNLRENVFYDTVLPGGGRSCGYQAQGFRYPVMGEPASASSGGKNRLWLHESGYDQLINGTPSPVLSYFETPFFGAPHNDPPDNKGYSLEFIEPDFTQSGDMTVGLYQSANARAPEALTKTVPMLAIPTKPQEQLVAFTHGSRLARLRFESNTLGGSYIAGRNLAHIIPAEPRVTS